jgi:Fe-S-cluster containining protein
MTARRDLPAGGFSVWLRGIRAVLAGEGEADVACGDCSACCITSHFVHVGPAEAQALAAIPRDLLFPAPGLPTGSVVMGYDEQGCCPMLTGGRCSIYEDRPLTCRTYDCRIFAAAGISADTDLITRRARRWRFDHPAAKDRDEHAAVRAAARFLLEQAECFPGGAGPAGPVRVALLSVKAYEVFLDLGEETGATGQTATHLDVAEAMLEADERFEAARSVAQASSGAHR